MAILVTGGTGFIGSHTVVELLQSGYEVVIADNLYNSKAMVVDRIEKITGKRPAFYELDVCDKAALDALFDKEKIDAVIHFAGYKAVGESTRKPIEYYENNLGSTLTLCKSMREHDCFKIVFSSSATVYGDPAFIPITEECPKGITTNPYGETKSMQERILTDIWKADNRWKVMLLRYFNPIGAHKSGTMGENPSGIPSLSIFRLMSRFRQILPGLRRGINSRPVPRTRACRTRNALRTWLRIVASAAPPIPSFSTATNNISSAMFTPLQIRRKRKGLLESPTARSPLAPIL